MNDHLGKAILDIAIFLEFSSEEIVDADAAIATMEQLAEELQKMTDHDKGSLINCWLKLAGNYGEKEDFVRSLPDALGLR